MDWVVLLVVVALIILAVQHWYITLPAAALIAAYHYGRKYLEKKEELEAEERDRLQREREREFERIRRHKEEQDRLSAEAEALAESSLSLYEGLPKTLSTANSQLAEAETFFEDNAFAPFWDSIESAARTLGQFHNEIAKIEANSKSYKELSSSVESALTVFPLSTSAVQATAERQQKVIRALEEIRDRH